MCVRKIVCVGKLDRGESGQCCRQLTWRSARELLACAGHLGMEQLSLIGSGESLTQFCRFLRIMRIVDFGFVRTIFPQGKQVWQGACLGDWTEVAT